MTGPSVIGRGRRSLLLVLLLALPLASGCTVLVQRIEEGRPLGPEDFHSVELGDDLGTVLARLGPPDRVWSTPRHEVLEYRHGLRTGTDVSLSTIFNSIPALSTALGLARAALMRGTRSQDDEPEEFQSRSRDPIVQLLPLAIGFAAGNLGDDLSTQNLIDLRNRRLRQDLLRLVVDPQSDRLVSKSFWPVASSSLLESILLRE